MWGLNSRLDNFQAAVLSFQFKDYDQIIEHRRALASVYAEHLGDLTSLVLPPAPDADPERFDVFQNYEVEADQRDALRDFLKAQDIGTLIQWGASRCTSSARLASSNPYRKPTASSSAASCCR